MSRKWTGLFAVLALAACAPDVTAPVRVLDQQAAPATGGVTIVLPGDGHRARGITPSGWILGSTSGSVVTWDPNDNWTLDTLASPANGSEQWHNTRGDVIIGKGSPSVTHVYLATNGGGPFTSAPGNPLARPADTRDGSWGASSLNAGLVLVGSAIIEPPAQLGMWYPMYWPYIDGGWPEARRLPGPTSMVSAIAGAINDSGLVVGDIGINSGTRNVVVARAWLLHGSGAATTVDTLPTLPWYPGAELMEATAVNNEGVIVGYYRRNGNDYPVAWLPAATFEYSYASIPVALSVSVSSSQNLPVNSCGWVALAAYSVVKGKTIPAAKAWNVWTNDVVTFSDPAGSTGSQLYDIADNGDVVGDAVFALTRKTSVRRPILWRGYLPSCPAAP